MHWSTWKPLAHCAALFFEKRSKSRDGSRNSSPFESKGIFSRIREKRLQEAIQEASDDGLLYKSLEIEYKSGSADDNSVERSRTLARLECQGLFLRATAQAAECVYESVDAIPDIEEAISKFLDMYPTFQSSQKIDQLRVNEYAHLYPKVCLDFVGFGLFSYLQSVHYWESSTFSLSEITANLSNHALYGGAEKGTVEHDIKTRIMDYLNIPENEYGLVFTVSRGSAFKLLAESYPFQTNKRLLTMFDHESQSVNWMAQSAREKGAKVYHAWFKWPTLQPCSTELRKQILSGKRKKKGSAAGLFVFPVQSRVSGTKYSYQWMALAHQNNWHVLLDAGSLGPKDMDSLGLSLFRPDFIITSFYRVFGYDPSGFGCLLIKKSLMGYLQNQSGSTGSGMVKLTPEFPLYVGDSVDGLDGFAEVENEVNVNGDAPAEPSVGQQLPAFSGLYTSAQVKDVFDTEMNHETSSDKDGASTYIEESGSLSVGDMMKSPLFSENGSSDYSYWIDLGQSPLPYDGNGQLNRETMASPLPPSWFGGRKNKQRFPKQSLKIYGSPVDAEKEARLDHDDYGVISFDAAVQSASQDLNHQKEGQRGKEHRGSNNVSDGRVLSDHRYIGEIEEEPEIIDESHNASRLKSTSLADNCGAENGKLTDLGPQLKESAIRRETEGEFRLLRSRRGKGYTGGRLFHDDDKDLTLSGGRVSFSVEDNHKEHLEPEMSIATPDDEELASDGEYEDAQDYRAEPEIVCRHLDHVNELGLNKTSTRLRFLVNWLVTSLLQLRLPSSDGNNGVPLVHIYGPKVKYERGAAVAFNVRDGSKALIDPEIIQKLAEKEGISLGVGFLSRIKIVDGSRQHYGTYMEDASFCKPMENGRNSGKHGFVRVEVLTASLGFLTNFDDVYKLWAFVAKFLNPTFARQGDLPPVEENPET
ncbi:hypothetical protein MLD38_028901 [Melastoma candidum]|uniref:Uncharacterized protein n=2 Tax=Melastoma candidum TaxID=119954 RepID=A0ACB9N2C3_9MYRT|nr:hypothetical protein MLD38_028901 [Melastoma candidum]